MLKHHDFQYEWLEIGSFFAAAGFITLLISLFIH